MAAPVLDSPFDRLHDLPRGVWLQTLITGAGNVAARLSGAQVWLQALLQGQLPPATADFGDAPATAGLRRAVGELALPRLCRDTPCLLYTSGVAHDAARRGPMQRRGRLTVLARS